MKRSILITGLLMVYGLAISQVIVDSTKKWNNVLNSEWGFLIGSELIRFGSDTVVDSKTYKKVLKATSDVSPDWALYGIIRETPDKKIYYKYSTDTPESLMYDFGAQVNDTVTPTVLVPMSSGTGVYLWSYPMVVSSIDSVIVGDEMKRQLHMAPADIGYETDQWIEGMGSKAGMLHCEFGLVGGYNFRLVCYYENDSLKYLNPDYSDCFVISSVDPVSPREKRVSIIPNPVRGSSVISIPNKRNEQVNLEIYTCTGKLAGRMEARDNMIIYGKDYSPGIYLFRFSYASGVAETIKVQIF